MIKNLYDFPEIYDRVFPADEEDVKFFATLAGGGSGPILDAAAGSGNLARSIATMTGSEVFTVDLSTNLQRGAGKFGGVTGDLLRLPFRDASFGFAYSRLFGYAYALAADASNHKVLTDELARVLRSGARFALELPVAYEPKPLQGIREQTIIAENFDYEFQYLDIDRLTSFGAVLHSAINVQLNDAVYTLQTPIHVFTPNGVAEWLEQSGLKLENFYASYDLDSATNSPPSDCLRAVIRGSKT